jgi:hypothetical protein
MAALSSNPRPVEILEFDKSLSFILVQRATDGGREWTIMRRDACLGAFDTIDEAIAGAWVALMITRQTSTADMLWDWRNSVINGRRAA